jgi:acetyl esterase/lipase/nicotinamidase-related amidase
MLHLTLRKRVETAPGSGTFQASDRPAAWPAEKTAVIVCDMWTKHWCAGARRRGAEMAPRMNEFLQEARKRGVLVIHAPSGAMDLYKDHPARKRAQMAPKAANLPKGIADWCSQIEAEKKGKYPVDQSDGGCDDQPPCDSKSKMDLHQMAVLEIRDEDALSDSGVEIWNLMEQRGIANVMLLGVHTNMCVLGRPFGLRNMARFGKNVVLVRDLTDTMYNPRAWPHVSHFRGTELIVQHIEKYVCPTITSDQLLGGKPFRFSGDAKQPNKPGVKAAAKAPPALKPTLADVSYGPSPKQVLDFYRADSGTPAPLVFHIHGGGWMGGSKAPFAAAPFLKAGLSVVSIEYRFVSEAQAAGVKPPVQWPLHDAARALQFVRSKAGPWNIDKTRIGATGGSAGACSSLWLAFHDDMADPQSADPVARESTRLTCAAVAGAQTTLDPKQMKEWTPNSTYGGHAFGFAVDRTQSAFQQFLEGREKILPWIKEYSPYELATADDPPVFLAFGAPPALGQAQKDPTHSANFGLKLQEKLRGLGVECHLAYPGAPDLKYRSIHEFLIAKLKAPAKRAGAEEK